MPSTSIEETNKEVKAELTENCACQASHMIAIPEQNGKVGKHTAKMEQQMPFINFAEYCLA